MRFDSTLRCLFIAALLCGAASAQMSNDRLSGIDPSQRIKDPIPGMTQGEAMRFREWYIDSLMANGKLRGDLKSDEVRVQVNNLVGALHLPCAPADSALVGASMGADRKTFRVMTYEVGCTNAMGYLLVWQSGSESYSVSCFAAEAAHRADPEHSELVCTLPANADSKRLAGAVLQRAGVNCPVREVRWYGRSQKAAQDYTEIACSDGAGYMIEAGATLKATNCHDAALEGLSCRLTAGGTPVVTAQTFKDALAQHNVACTDAKVRLVGRENVGKRHVVEFACANRAGGFVAFIPVGDTNRPFETVDCATAPKRGVLCQLKATN